MARTASITFAVRFAWWVRPYIAAVAAFARLTGMTPDPDKVSRTVKRGMRIKQIKG